MCGVVGLVTPGRVPDQQQVVTMADQLRHRGPDDSGFWQQGSVALGHRRLSVVDLSSAGHQPMLSASGRWVLAYNGEVYNHEAIRQKLPDIPWRGHCDSEVILEAIERWGVVAAIGEFVGMFALAAFDTEREELWLVRDRLGIKPLYYGWLGNDFIFASELSPFGCCATRPEIDRSSVRSYLRYGAVPAPHSIYQGVQKLEPGAYVKLELNKASNTTTPDSTPYWALEDHSGVALDITEEEATDQLHALLRIAVSDRMIADVPLGAFLSGGYDSSLVCALMQEQSSQPVKTFTIGFDNPKFNESIHAERIAEHLGTDHTELIMQESATLDAVDLLPGLCDEPFADSSILPTYLVSSLARQHVTVSLSGDGGDELFWGYPRYELNGPRWQRLAKYPASIRALAAGISGNQMIQHLTKFIRVRGPNGRPGYLNEKLQAAADLYGARSAEDLYHRLMSQWVNPDLLLEGEDLPDVYNNPAHWIRQLSGFGPMAAQDTLAYLPNTILTKLDRASMAVSLEARVPLLDHRVVEFAARLPDTYKRRDGQSKYLLRKVLARYVPAELTDRPKMGFGVPLAEWLRGPLQEWSADLLSADTLKRQGLLKGGHIQQLWQSHVRGDADYSARLWVVLMLNSWIDTSER